MENETKSTQQVKDLKANLSNLENDYNILLNEYKKMKEERDTLIDDLPVVRASNVRLQRENRKLQNEYNELTRKHYTQPNKNVEDK